MTRAKNTKKIKKVMIDVIPPKKRVKTSRVTSSRSRYAPPILLTFRRARSIALILMVTLNAAFINGVGTTAAYYLDSEGAQNTFTAGKVDFVLTSTPYTLPAANNISSATTTTRMIKVVPEPDSNPFWYQASSTNFGIDLDFCATLDLAASLEGVANYSGALADFLSPATTTLDDWQFDIGTAINSYNKVCTFNFDFNAWQERHNLPGFEEMGYNDTETEINRIASQGFRLNKVYYDVEEGSDEPPPNQCPARSMGYWANNEGCSGGTGSALWNDEVNTLSATYASLFATSTGPGMCSALWIPNCPSGDTKAAKLCKAKAHTLADEMNVVSGKLDPNAIISGADDGNSAFDSLGLTPFSTISQALAALEAVLANPSSTSSKINKAGYVAQRLYTFYEEENANAPYCIYSGPSTLSISRGAEKTNEWVEIYNQTDAALDISGWSICDNTSCDVIPTTDPIPSLGYGLITASTTTALFWHFPSTMPVIILPDGSIGNGLNNDNDMLLLKRPDGVIMDQMNYGPDPDTGWNNYNSDIWDPGAVDVSEGNTLARNPSGYDTDQPSDWVELGPPTVNLIYPDQSGIESWYWGSTYDIEWTATNPNGPDSALTVDLYLIKDVDDSETVTPPDTIQPIVLGTENDGHYDFTVPNGFTGYIWIKIVVTGSENPMLNDMMISGKLYDPLPPTLTPEEIEEEIEEEEEELANAETVGDGAADPALLEALVSDALETSASADIAEETETSAPAEESITTDENATVPESRAEGTMENPLADGTNTETIPPEEEVPAQTPSAEITEDLLAPTTDPHDDGLSEDESTVASEETNEDIMDFDLLRREEEETNVPPLSEEDGEEKDGNEPSPVPDETISETESMPEEIVSTTEVTEEIPETDTEILVGDVVEPPAEETQEPIPTTPVAE